MYQTKRQQFYDKIEGFWANLYDEEYALFDIKYMTAEEVVHVRLVSERIGAIFFKTVNLLRNVPDETLLEMGYPKETLSFIRLKTLPVPSVISRLDLIPYKGSYKCIEINSDTPTFIKELFSVNAAVCAEFNAVNPNERMDELLKRAVQTSLKVSSAQPDPHIVFTAHEDTVEDYNTVLYLMEGVPNAKFTPLHQLKIRQGVGLFDENDKQIDILYRQTFPIENLIQDTDAEGNAIGLWLLELVEQKKLVILNPPEAFLLQNKAVQAVIWGLHEEKNPIFTSIEHEWIDEYFLPTYLEATPFIEQNISYVKKPSFGREGDTVEIFNGSGNLMLEDNQKSYRQYTPIYQHFIEQPKTQFESEKGVQNGQLLIGSFLLNGKAGAIGYRVGGQITNNLSYYLPLGIK